MILYFYLLFSFSFFLTTTYPCIANNYQHIQCIIKIKQFSLTIRLLLACCGHLNATCHVGELVVCRALLSVSWPVSQLSVCDLS